VLLLVLPTIGAGVVLQTHWWGVNLPAVAWWTVGLSVLLGLVAWKLRTATPWAAVSGALITASLTFSTTVFPYSPWRTALVPLLTLLVLTSLATRLGRRRKESLGTGEARHGRAAAQVAANLGVAALVSSEMVQSALTTSGWFPGSAAATTVVFSVGLAALAESAADTVSSELGQVLGGTPRMITTLRKAEPGTDGAISLVGTFAGIAAAVLVALAGALSLGGGAVMFWIACGAGTFGLFFDSLLGATLERRGWLNNDAVNFLSTVSSAAFAVILLAAVFRK
jgi:uncharacterized protein (TIGR00297 family)